MKINEVITNSEFDKITEIIENNCSDILKLYRETGSMLYRGVRGIFVPYFIQNQVENRRPKDTSLADQEKVDTLLKGGGFTALRSNSIFASGSFFNANAYGQVYDVFPFNGFAYTWSTKLNDFYEKYDAYPYDVYTLKNIKLPEELIKTYGFTNTNIKNALNSSNEILIYGKCLLVKGSMYEKSLNKFIGYYQEF